MIDQAIDIIKREEEIAVDPERHIATGCFKFAEAGVDEALGPVRVVGVVDGVIGAGLGGGDPVPVQRVGTAVHDRSHLRAVELLQHEREVPGLAPIVSECANLSHRL